LNQFWQPEQDGFEFSTSELTLWMRRRQLEEEADDFRYHGYLPETADSSSRPTTDN
jgi:hypothetical protein